MKVLKRSGILEEVSFDKILRRIQSLCDSSEFSYKLNIDPTVIAQKTVQEIYDGVSTETLDKLSSEISISLYSTHPDYKLLAGRIVISNHHKNTVDSFSEKIEILNNVHTYGLETPLIADYLYKLVQENKELIDSKIDYTRDYLYDFFGFKTLEKSYLYKEGSQIIERPQDMIMRVSLSIHRDNLEKAFETYDYMSNHYFTHATPTLYNAGSKKEQFASCFLLTMNDDSIKGIYKTLSDCALISKHAGGIGLSIHSIRANESFISGTNGKSNGLVPMLRVFNDTARYVDQGGGKRNGSFAMYLEPWHSDIFDFLELKKNHGNELERARDLFYALWIPDLFMKRVKEDGEWSLFCPNECPGLSDVWGSSFDELYTGYESSGKARRKVKARSLWSVILTSQIETGNPYLIYKDSCNQKSNQKNLGTIKSSNLCTEIIEYTSPEETAVCNLASISLKSFVKYKNFEGVQIVIYTKPNCIFCRIAKGLCSRFKVEYEEEDYRELELTDEMPTKIQFPQIFIKEDELKYIGGYSDFEDYIRPTYDYEKLIDITKVITNNLNNIIDYNFYPTPETKVSNKRHRPIGIGVQGFSNVLFEMMYSFDSHEAKELNQKIFETIYYGSMVASMEISKQRAHQMEIYKNALSQYDVCMDTSKILDATTMEQLYQSLQPIQEEIERDKYLGSYSSFEGSPLQKGQFQFDLWPDYEHLMDYDWSGLMSEIQEYGVRNSLLVAPMPTASTAQILGNYECFEPIISNIYTRRVLAGEYMVMNDYLVDDLLSLGLWSKDLKDKIIVNEGSVLNITEIPPYIRQRYKTVWELKQKVLIDMAIDRGKYICQSQSLNLFQSNPTISALTSMHFYSWENGLKTGIYYLRTRPSSKAIQFTVSPESCESCSG